MLSMYFHNFAIAFPRIKGIFDQVIPENANSLQLDERRTTGDQESWLTTCISLSQLRWAKIRLGCVWCYLFPCILFVCCSEDISAQEMSPLPVKAANFRPILGTYCLWAGGHTCRDTGLQILRTLGGRISQSTWMHVLLEICAIVQECLIWICWSQVPLRIFHPYRDVIIAGAGLQPLRRFSAVSGSREGSLPCPTYCDTGLRVLRSHSSDRGQLVASVYCWPILTWFSVWTCRK